MNFTEQVIHLTNMHGISGDEYAVSEAARALLAPFVDSAEVDPFGNVIGRKSCGGPGAPTLLLDAHLDQVGFMVSGVTDEGFVRFVAISVDPRMLPGSELLVKTKNHGVLPGVVATLPPHLRPAGKKAADSYYDVAAMALDMGLPAEKAKQMIAPGDPVIFAGDTQRLQGDALCGRAMDDRACFACLLQVLELLDGRELGVDLIVLGSTREEVGLQGARDVANRENPDYAIALDVTHGKTPDSGEQVANEVAKGPVIAIGANSNPALANRVAEIARAKQIPYQLAAVGGSSGTNAWAMQTSGLGICTLVLSLPLKYMHSPVELIHTGDAENLARLVAEFIANFEGGAQS